MIAREVGRNGVAPPILFFSFGVPLAPGEAEYITIIRPGREREGSLVGFWGEFEHTVDDRGRMAVPARYRDEFVKGGMLTMASDGCVELYTENDFDDMSKDVAAQPRTTREGRRSRRDFYGQSFPVDLDRQGRILIPAKVRQQAALDGPVVIIGTLECLEIWNSARLEQDREARAASSAEQASGA